MNLIAIAIACYSLFLQHTNARSDCLAIRCLSCYEIFFFGTLNFEVPRNVAEPLKAAPKSISGSFFDGRRESPVRALALWNFKALQ